MHIQSSKPLFVHRNVADPAIFHCATQAESMLFKPAGRNRVVDRAWDSPRGGVGILTLPLSSCPKNKGYVKGAR